MQRIIVFLTSYFLFTTCCFGQVQQAIDDLIGEYITYNITNACGQPPWIDFPNFYLNISQVNDSDTVLFDLSYELDSLNEQSETLALVTLEEGPTGMIVSVETINPTAQFQQNEILDPNHLVISQGNLCQGCNCHYVLYFVVNTFANFAGADANWTYKTVESFPQPQQGPDQLLSMQSVGTEVINNIECKKIERFNVACNADVDQFNYVFDSAGVVYWYNEILDDFTILYDLNAQAGDGWITHMKDCELQVWIDSVSYITIDGQELKVLHPNIESDGFGDSPIIEKIGRQGFIFPTLSQGSTIDQPCFFGCDGYNVSELRCYTENDFAYINIPTGETCQSLATSTEVFEDSKIEIYPTITDAEINILATGAAPIKITTISIYDINGSLVQQNNSIDTYSSVLTIDNLGFYIVNIKLVDGMEISKKIVVR